MWDLSSPNQRSNPCPLQWKQSLNHWTAREILGILILQAQFTYIAVQGHEARKGRARGLHERLSVSKVQVFHPMLTFIPCLAQCLGSQWSREWDESQVLCDRPLVYMKFITSACKSFRYKAAMRPLHMLKRAFGVSRWSIKSVTTVRKGNSPV